MPASELLISLKASEGSAPAGKSDIFQVVFMSLFSRR